MARWRRGAWAVEVGLDIEGDHTGGLGREQTREGVGSEFRVQNSEFRMGVGRGVFGVGLGEPIWIDLERFLIGFGALLRCFWCVFYVLECFF